MPTRRPTRLSPAEHTRSDVAYNLFQAKVIRVDYERMIVSLLNLHSNQIIDGVCLLPSSGSSPESTEVVMPEIGSTCLACYLSMTAGYAQTVVVSWHLSSTTSGIDAVAVRPTEDTPGWSNRRRGVYRKTYPGERTTVLTDGFTEKHNAGWDKAASDFSREKQDPLKRTRIETNGRKLSFNDSGLSMEGFINRPGALETDITPKLLPDGSKEWILYLNGLSSDGITRYTEGAQDMIPLVERTEKIPEFALDYTVPIEVLETYLMDVILGTTSDPWARTLVLTDTSKVSYDSQSYMINQGWDHPSNAKTLSAGIVGPTLKEGPTPQRRAWMIEKTEGTLVGSNLFDPSTYGKVLKPVIFNEKFGSNLASHYSPVTKTIDQAETRLAASAFSLRFPYETNTTRFDVTKEGMISFEIGATLPKENVPFDSYSYEYPWGAGRSIEGSILGSVRLLIGKNREEEDSLDLTTLGGTYLRLGADDTSLPTTRRSSKTQIRGQMDTVGDRTIQSWTKPKMVIDPLSGKLVPVTQGDIGSNDLSEKHAMENVSLRAAMDGGMFLRLGARHTASKRRHLKNGYKDGLGRVAQSVFDESRVDSHSPNRPTYGASTNNNDEIYKFHDLTMVGKSTFPDSKPEVGPYAWSGDPIGDMRTTGLSADIHTVRDVLFRIGKNAQNGQSLLMDLDGGIVAAIGKDLKGRSLTASLDGGIEATIGSITSTPKAVRLEMNGDVDITINGNLHLNVTGDIIVDGVRILQTAKIGIVNKSLVIVNAANVAMLESAPQRQFNQGGLQAVAMFDKAEVIQTEVMNYKARTTGV